jgi:multiple sugar transport system permease protein
MSGIRMPRSALSPIAGDRRDLLHRARGSWRRSGGVWAVVFALPAVLAFAYFSWGPMIRAVVMSFQKTNFVGISTWVGLDNFTYVLSDPLLPTALLNTLYFTLLALVFGFPVPLFLAVLISELRHRGPIYSALAYLPVVIPPVVAILLWKIFYDPSATGLFNSIFGAFGLGPFPWLNSPSSAMPAIMIEATWASAGSTVVIYLAALTNVRAELYDAAELDGASIWSRIWHVTLPQIRGVILIMLLLQVIGTMQIFTEVFVFTDGGPHNATMSILLMIYRYAFQDGDFGAATALSVLLALLLGAISIVYQLLTRKWAN